MKNYKVNIINNLLSYDKTIKKELAEEIVSLIKSNLKETNIDEYTDEEIEFLISKKTVKSIYSDLENGLLVYVTNKENLVIALGFAIKQNDKYIAKRLNVKPEYKGQGLGKLICNIRENELRKIGVKELFIQSLKFRTTINFHETRGFKLTESYKKLKRTVYMKKVL